MTLKRPQSRRGHGHAVAHTVDKFQGDQAHTVIVSLVRNTRMLRAGADEIGKPLGFLRFPHRANVLFSRAEALLVLVGSWEFFEVQCAGVPEDPSHTMWHWRELLRVFRELEKVGTAVRIQGTGWTPVEGGRAVTMGSPV